MSNPQPFPRFEAADTEQVMLPNDWRPRKHQRKVWLYFEGGGKRAAVVWHRRAGKDSFGINMTAVKTQERVGTYWHMLPEAKQGKKVIWDALDKSGRRIIDQAFPIGMRESTNITEMQIKLVNGSVWQVVGSDNYNSLVGANPVGVIFSEYSISNPAAWDYIRPILVENGGWALFIYTPRGKNHGYKLFKTAEKSMAKGGPEAWFAELLTVDDTLLVSPETIAKEREDAELSGEDGDDLIDQEYFCSWTGGIIGAIYGKQMRKARESGRICAVPHARHAPVNTFWDIGHSDATSILCHQFIGVQHRFIKSYESHGQDIPHYVEWMRAQTGYLYGKHYLPHDARNVTVASASNPLGKNVYEQLVGCGIPVGDIIVVPRTPDLWAAIRETRSRFDECWFDEDGCDGFLNAIALYRKKWSEERQCFSDQPFHDWTSNFADAFRQWAQGWELQTTTGGFTPPRFSKASKPGFTKPVVGSRRVGY